MKCGYCGVEYVDEQAHYCSAGRDLIVAENSRLRAALAAKDAEIERLNRILDKLREVTDYTDLFVLAEDVSKAITVEPKPGTCEWHLGATGTWWETECGSRASMLKNAHCFACGRRVEVRE